MSESEDTRMNHGADDPVGRIAGELSDELKSLEARLAAMSPRDDRVDRERLMFLAGQASVEAIKRHRTSSRDLKLHDQIWARAFAAMTAVAATLLVILITRPAGNDVSPPAVNNIARETRQLTTLRGANNAPFSLPENVLLTRDALNPDIESLLETGAAKPSEALPNDGLHVPVLTPAAWRQIINGAASSVPPSSSSLSPNESQGINS